MAPALRASIAAGPALNVWVVSLVCAEVLGEEPLADADQGRGVGDVVEIAEPEFGGRAAVRGRRRGGFLAAGQRGGYGGAGADQEHEPRGQGDLEGALALGLAGLAGDDPGGAGLAGLSPGAGFSGVRDMGEVLFWGECGGAGLGGQRRRHRPWESLPGRPGNRSVVFIHSP